MILFVCEYTFAFFEKHGFNNYKGFDCLDQEKYDKTTICIFNLDTFDVEKFQS